MKRTQAVFLVLGALTFLSFPVWAIPTVEVAPVSVEDTIKLKQLAEIESCRQGLILDLQALGWTTSTDARWGNLVDYSAYPLTRVIAHASPEAWKVRFVWTGGKTILELFRDEPDPVASWTDAGPAALQELLRKIADDDALLVPRGPVNTGEESGADFSEVLQWGFSTRVATLKALLASLGDQAPSAVRALDIARIWALQAAYLSLSDNRPFLVDSARALAWLELVQGMEGLTEAQVQQAREIKAVVWFFLDCTRPDEGLLPETMAIRNALDMGLREDKTYPPVASLFDLLVRQRVYGTVRGTSDAKFTFAWNSDSKPADTFDPNDAGNLVVWSASRRAGTFNRGAYMVATSTNQIWTWLTSFNKVLFALFEDEAASPTEAAWNNPLRETDRLVKVLYGDADPPALIGDYHKIMATGFGMLALWAQTPRPDPGRKGWALRMDDVADDFVLRFQEQLLGYKGYFTYIGSETDKQMWEKLNAALTRERGRMLPSGEVLASGTSFPQETTKLWDTYLEYIRTWKEAMRTRDPRKILEAARNMADSRLLGEDFYLAENSDLENSLSVSPLAWAFEQAGQVKEGLRVTADLVNGSFGPETFRNEILGQDMDNLEAWRYYFKPGRNSWYERFTRVQYAFQTFDWNTVSSLVGQSLNHYNGDTTMALFGLSARLVLDPDERTPVNWEYLEHDLGNWDPKIRNFQGWYRPMNAALADSPGWQAFRDSHHLQVMDTLYALVKPTYQAQEPGMHLDKVWEWFHEADRQLAAADTLTLSQRHNLIYEWATLLGRYFAKAGPGDLGPLVDEGVKVMKASVEAQTNVRILNLNYSALSDKFLTLLPYARAVRYGMSPEKAAEAWSLAAKKAYPHGLPLTKFSLDLAQRAILGSQAGVMEYLSKTDSNSYEFVFDDLKFPEVQADEVFSTAFRSGDDQVALTMAFESLKARDPKYFRPFIKSGDWPGWCRENAPNRELAQAWMRGYDEALQATLDLQAERKAPLPRDIPSFSAWLETHQ